MLKNIYIIHHTHYDIGFTDLPDEVERQQLVYLDEAVRLGEADPDYCWTIESGSLLRNYLDYRPPEQAERLLKLLRKGQFEVGAYDMQMLTECASFAELLANCTRIAELGRKYGFPVQTAILDDIGGWASETPTLMNQAGIRYLIAGCGAYQTELPWADLPHLFYLQCKSGGKILVWNLGNDRTVNSCESKHPYAVYGMASIFIGYRNYPEHLGIFDLGVNLPMPEDGEEYKLSGKDTFNIFTSRLEKEKYLYPEILMQYGGDNRNPAPELADLIRKLNATGDYPAIKLTTPSGFFRMMEEKYGDSIPVIKGFLADPWNLRLNAVPTVLKNHRKAQRIYDGCRLKGFQDDTILENLMLTSDHTIGLHTWGWQKSYEANGKTLSASCFDRFRESWKCKAYYAETSMRRAIKLSRLNAAKAEYMPSHGIIIRNSAPHIISGNAELYLGDHAKKMISLKYTDGREVPRQLIGQNRWMLYVENIPALGTLRLTVEFSHLYDEKPLINESILPQKITNRFFELDFAADGTLQTIKSTDGRILMQGGCGDFLIQNVNDAIPGSKFCGLRPSVDRTVSCLADKSAKILTDGELFTEVMQKGSFKNGTAERVLRIWKNIPRIDFAYRLNIAEHYEKVCYYAKFPFAGNTGNFFFDSNVGINTTKELLPGSMLDMFCCSRFVALENKDFCAALCCIDAPVVEFDDMHTCEWRKKLPLTFKNNHIYGLIYNNICNTDAPAWQRIIDTFNYSLFINDGNFSPAAAQAAWYSINALEAELAFEKSNDGIEGFPLELRVHSDAYGAVFLENLTDCEVIFKDKKIPPHALIKAE